MAKRWILSEAVRVTAVGNERVAIVGPTRRVLDLRG